MASHGGTLGGTVFDEDDTRPAEAGRDAPRDVLLWGLMAFALGMLSAWIGAMAWIAVRFLTV